jgi:serine/threonine-protein kinase
MESTSKREGPSDTEVEGSTPTSTHDVLFPALGAIAALHHPHLATLRRAASGTGFELVEEPGLSLEKLIEGPNGEGRLALRIRVRILLDVFSGLAALHRAKVDEKPIGFVHGEVAPHNILVGRDGVGKLVPLVESHWSTPPVPAEASLGYVAPERLLGDVFDQRADIFSVGVLLWEAIAEKRLFHNMRMDSIVTQLVGKKLSRPESSPSSQWADALADVAMQAIAVDPEDRWPHVGVMGAEIEAIAAGRLASSEEIALLVRSRLGEQVPSIIPVSDAEPPPEAPKPSSLPPGVSSMAFGPAPPSAYSGAAPAGGLVIWRGPQSVRPSPELAPRREFVRPAVGEPVSKRRGRHRTEASAGQSRIAWVAFGVGIALFGIAVHELLARDPSSPVPSADETAAAAAKPIARPEPVAPPPVAPPTPPKRDVGQRASPAPGRTDVASGTRSTSKPSAPNAVAPRTTSPSRASSKGSAPPQSQAATAPKPAPASQVEPAPAAPPAEPAPEPPAPEPKPKEDPFGI